MVDFPGKKNAPPAGFTLDKKALAEPRQNLKKRELRLVVMLFLGLLVFGWLIYTYALDYANTLEQMNKKTVATAVLPAMPQPTLEGADAVPGPDALRRTEISYPTLIAARQAPPSIGHELNALTLAWGLRRLSEDAIQPPLPVRVTARDLLHDHGNVGITVLLKGRITDSRQIDTTDGPAFTRLVYAIAGDGTALDQYVQVLAVPGSGADSVPLGEPALLVGRFLGKSSLPIDALAAPASAAAATSSTIELPLLLARRISLSTQEETVSPLMQEFRGVFSKVPDDAYTGIDDFRTVLETRPLYWLIGQVRADKASSLSYAEAPMANKVANTLHQAPHEHRGKPHGVRLIVYDAAEEREIASDKPFGVERAIRVLGYHEDWSPMTVTDKDGKSIEKMQFVLRLYEATLLGNQPLPARGSVIRFDGRFMKLHGRPVENDPNRDRRNNLTRQSNTVFSFFFVGDGYVLEPRLPRKPFGWIDAAIIVGCAIVLSLLFFLVRREGQARQRNQQRVLTLRSGRRRLRDAGQATAPATETASASPPDAGAAAPPSSEPPPPAA